MRMRSVESNPLDITLVLKVVPREGNRRAIRRNAGVRNAVDARGCVREPTKPTPVATDDVQHAGVVDAGTFVFVLDEREVRRHSSRIPVRARERQSRRTDNANDKTSR